MAVGESIITVDGLAAYRAASASGGLVRPKTFKFSNVAYALAESMALRDIGGVWRTADITAYMVVDNATVEFLCDVPPDLATDYCQTAGLYLDDGRLFMLARPPYPFPPGLHQRFKIQLRYGNLAALTDFVYLPPDEVEQDLSIIAARAGIGVQTMRNAQDIGLLKTALFCK